MLFFDKKEYTQEKLEELRIQHTNLMIKEWYADLSKNMSNHQTMQTIHEALEFSYKALDKAIDELVQMKNEGLVVFEDYDEYYIFMGIGGPYDF